jgi:hypothetical protein
MGIAQLPFPSVCSLLLTCGGDTRSVDLSFQLDGWGRCQQEVRLEANSGIVIDDKALQLEPVHFVPSRA